MDWFSFPVKLSASSKSKGGLAVFPFWKEGKAAASMPAKLLKAAEKGPVAFGDFKGEEGELFTLYTEGSPKERVLLLGLGAKEGITVEKLRRAYGALGAALKKMGAPAAAVALPTGTLFTETRLADGVVEGLLLSLYEFPGYKTAVKEKKALKHIEWIGASKEFLRAAERVAKQCEGVFLARNLINGNADDVTPATLAAVAKSLSKKGGAVKCTVFSKERIEKEKMGLLLAVSRGARVDPAFILLSYTGAPKSKEHTVFVGKGVTYDTGGLNIKPTGGMETMKRDMSGAAALLGVIHAAAALKIKVNITAVIPSTENSVDANSYKPGDVYTSYSGKTVEIGNTDAEGRLLLADALAYSVKNLKPTCIVDIATLTGAMMVALGPEAAGLFSNDEALASELEKAGEETYERLWRLPLFEEYREQLKSDIADLRNVGVQGAGSSIAATFLAEFVGKVPWAHLDIASVAYKTKGRPYEEKMATGFGVRLLLNWICR